MNIEIKSAAGLAERDTFAAAAYSPSILEKMQSDLNADGSLLNGDVPNRKQVSTMIANLGSFAAEKLVGFSPGLANTSSDQLVFAGGVCALSTRESTLLGIGRVEDPLTGVDVPVQESDGLTETVTAVQVFETIGLTPGPSAIVLEDSLWSERAIEKIKSSVPSVDDTELQAARRVIEIRNELSYRALRQLRNYMFDQPNELAAVRDTDVMTELTTGTDKMLARLGLPEDESSYRFVYAGMYSYVWRQIMAEQGVVGDDQTMVIYEPWKHFAPEDGINDPISSFRRAMTEQVPFMGKGSDNEKLALLAYAEPRDPNGRILRKSLPLSLQPNSANFRDFDFTKFPIVPKKNNALPNANEFGFIDKMNSITLDSNPAYMWGLAYPPTPRTRAIMSEMVRLKSLGQLDGKIANLRDPLMSAVDRRKQADDRRENLSREMEELSDLLVKELQTITNVLFGENNEIN